MNYAGVRLLNAEVREVDGRMSTVYTIQNIREVRPKDLIFLKKKDFLRELGKKMTHQHGVTIKIPEEFLPYPEILLEIVKFRGRMIEEIPGYFQTREVAMAAVSNYGYAYPYIREEFKEDLDIACATVNFYGRALEFLREYMKNSPCIVAIAVANNGMALEYASKELRDDREIVSIAVKENGMALEFASERLRDDDETVSAAALSAGRSLKFASERLRDNEVIVFYAIVSDGSSIELANERLKDDPAAVISAVLRNSAALERAGVKIKDDIDFSPENIENHIIPREIIQEILGTNYDTFIERVFGSNL